jgi:hypothetical protein
LFLQRPKGEVKAFAQFLAGKRSDRRFSLLIVRNRATFDIA